MFIAPVVPSSAPGADQAATSFRASSPNRSRQSGPSATRSADSVKSESCFAASRWNCSITWKR